jgi:MYXO-CTERM domain-containing protein
VVDFSWAQSWGFATVTAESGYEWIKGVAVRAGSNGKIVMDTPVSISNGHAFIRSSVVASDGTDFVVGWWEGDKLHAARFSGYDGSALDILPVEVASGLQDIDWLRVAYTGQGYVFSYLDGSSVKLVGTNLDLTPRFQTSPYEPHVKNAHVSCDQVRCTLFFVASGSNCAGVASRRFDPNGVWLGPSESLVSCISHMDPWWLVSAANHQPQPAFRSFMVAWNRLYDLNSARYRSESGAFLWNPATTNTSGVPLVMASDGTQFLLGYEENLILYLVGLDNLDGTAFPAPPVQAIGASEYPYPWPHMTFDGTDYALVSQTSNGVLQLRYFGKDVSIAEPTLDLLTAPVYEIGAASNAYGRTLVTFPRTFAPSSNPGYREMGVFVDNDRGPGTPPPPPPPDAGPGDAAAEAAPDGSTDASETDAFVEAATDASLDSDAFVDSPDELADTAVDQPADAVGDLPEDSSSDVAYEAGSDAWADGPAADSAVDAGVTDALPSDGSPTAEGAEDGGGCGCRTSSRESSVPIGWSWLALAALLRFRRRPRTEAMREDA